MMEPNAVLVVLTELVFGLAHKHAGLATTNYIVADVVQL